MSICDFYMFTDFTGVKYMKNKITDVAVAAGVSTATVSRVFSKHPYVKDDIKKAVLAAAKKLNYAPKFSSPLKDFGIVVGGRGDISIGPYETQVIRAVSKVLSENNYSAQIITASAIEYLHKNSFRALIAISTAAAEFLPFNGVPSITINNPVKKIHSVATDHGQGIELAFDYLVGMGHRKIAFVGQSVDSWGELERERGYRASLEKYDMPFNEKYFIRIDSSDDMIESIGLLMKSTPTAMIVTTEGRGQIINYALYLLNKKIPDDISVISFEDPNNSRFFTPPHTTVSQNFELLGKTAAEKAIELADGKHTSAKPFEILLKNKLIERQSVKKI